MRRDVIRPDHHVPLGQKDLLEMSITTTTRSIRLPTTTAATLLLLLLACTGCGGGGQRVSVPFIRCHHVSEAAAGAGVENVYVTTIAQLVAPDGSGEAQQRRFPSGEGATYAMHTGNIVGRGLSNESGEGQTLPVIWDEALKPGQRLVVFVRVGTPGASDAGSAPLLSSLENAVKKDASLSAPESATLRHLGVVAKESPAFAPPGSATLGAFAVV